MVLISYISTYIYLLKKRDWIYGAYFLYIYLYLLTEKTGL